MDFYSDFSLLQKRGPNLETDRNGKKGGGGGREKESANFSDRRGNDQRQIGFIAIKSYS